MARPIAQDHGDKRRAIMTCAAQVFAREGFQRASMAQVAQAATISKANIYHYWDSKDALLFDILDAHLSHLRDVVLGVPQDRPPEERLQTLCTAILLAYQGADDAHRLQIAATADLPDPAQDILRGYQREMVVHVDGLIRDIAGARADLRALTMSVFGMLNWHYMWAPGADAEARQAYAKTVVDLALNGMGQDQANAQAR